MTEIFHSIVWDLSNLIESAPYLWIFIFMTLESSFIPFPSEIVMIPAWYFASKWEINIFIAIFLGTLWSIVWALINYVIWYYWWVWLSKKILWNKYHDIWIFVFKKYWDVITLWWRLIPIIRQLISVPAWIFNMNLKKFVFYTWLWAFVWVAFLAWIWRLWWNNEKLLYEYKYLFIWWVFLLVVVIFFLKFKLIKYLEKKSKQTLK